VLGVSSSQVVRNSVISPVPVLLSNLRLREHHKKLLKHQVLANMRLSSNLKKGGMEVRQITFCLIKMKIQQFRLAARLRKVGSKMKKVSHNYNNYFRFDVYS